jgi:hypothetical protein
MAHTYAIPSIDDVQDKTVMKYCDEGLKEIESVIIEAEKNFSIKEYLAWV